MPCADCGAEVRELVQCEVCGKRVCSWCFAEAHDTLPLVEEAVNSVN